MATGQRGLDTLFTQGSRALAAFSLFCILQNPPPADAALDLNTNQQSDVWEMRYGATGLTANADADGDGVRNTDESVAGTDPLNGSSFPGLDLRPAGTNAYAAWTGLAGKRYLLQSVIGLGTGTWQTVGIYTGANLVVSNVLNTSTSAAPMYRVVTADLDTDGDTLTDWEELQLNFDPTRDHTERYAQSDLQRVTAGMNATTNQVTVGVRDGEMSERWPEPAVIAIRRIGSLRPITVNFTIGGTATRDTDYTMPAGNSIAFPAGVREAWIEFQPVADALDSEGTETITLTATAGTNYTLATNISATVNLVDQPASAGPSAKEAARFLIQAAFGPDADDTNDVDIVPENVEQVMSMGFDAWIDDQFTRPVGLLEPFIVWGSDTSNVQELYTDLKEASWWNRAMGVTTLYPGGPTVAPDPLRQRLTFALSQVFVISDRLEALGVSPLGMANYYDTLMTNAFGNFRSLIYAVTVHPCMGLYLSHLQNQKPDPVNNIFPDENYAREIMQLFTIGLWQLNQDGTKQLGTNGLPIPTYNNANITEFARVFTGLSYGGTNANSFLYAQQNLLEPMKMYDDYHDCNAKTLLNGAALPARTANSPTPGAAGLADLNAAMDNLFYHTNVAPFISYRLIQRFVTSNPSTGYIARVAAKFNDNGSGVRGDLKAVIKQVLLDPEARNASHMSDPAFGKQREPFLRVVNFGRAFNAAATCGFYALDTFYMDHSEEPLKSPSVFNFYLPGYTPPGPLNGLVAPEFQIVNASTAISGPNYYYNAIPGGLHRWGSADPARTVKLDLAPLTALATDVDALIRRIDLSLTGGTLSPREFQLVKESVERITSGVTSQWVNERAYMAIYLIVTSPEFCVMR